MKNYNILKNIISKEDINKFNYLLLDRNFPWFFEHQTNNNPFNYSNTFEHIAFVHWFILNSKENSKYIGQFKYIIKKLPFKYEKILRAKVNLLPQIKHDEDQYNSPHIDLPDRSGKEYKICIVYLNNSDGDTFLFKDKKIIKRVKPKTGNALIMNGDIPHSSSHPIKNKYRIVLNINYLS